ncbi:MAG: ABC transporter ATP-binding protein, partial [Pseudomonadales bacterium]|nr:ABC transporter ATP-binding protein [Pseudomonadales bacterium]
MTSSSVNSQLEATTALDTSGALAIVKRSLRYAWDLRYRYVVKLLMAILAIFPPLILVWPFKIIVDNVVLGHPIGQSLDQYPFFIRPLVEFLAGKSTLEIMLILVVFGIATIMLLGAFGESGTTTTQRDGVNSDLAEGTDIATRTENQANKAQSSIGGLLGYLEFLWTIRISHRLNYRLRGEVFRKLQRLPMSTLEDERIGDAVYRVMYDTPSITELCDKTIVVPVQTILQIYVVLLMLDFSFSEAPELFWIGLSALPIFFFVFLIYTGRLRRQWETSRNLGATTTASMEESLGNILAVQSLGGQQREMDRFSASSRLSFRGYLLGYGLMLMVFLTGIAIFAGIVMYALTIMTDLIIAGVLTAGDLVVIYVFYFRIFDASRKLGGLWLDLQFPIAGMRRVFLMLDLPDEKETSSRPFPGIERSLRFENVSFTYPDGTRALEQIDFTAHPGQMVALVGATGSGTPTLAYMIPRFLDPTSARVLIDAEDTAGSSPTSLRDHYTHVFQENTFFMCTKKQK